ncbi:MAG TPA: LPS export ABC transporter periplasmic protein LptC [Chthoniobacteraceae bacterium]|nr:LPS export ABC transporter periplasmic protein LptC [Chthoniobacteraceae bacterium]
MKPSARIPNRRLLLRNGWLGLAMAALLCWPSGGHASDKKKAKEERDGIQVPIPIGHKAQGIKLPDFDENGNLRMNFEIGAAERVSGKVMEMSDLKIEMFGEDGASEMMMELSHSQIDLETRILSSAEPVTIHRHDLELTGSHMTFNTRTREGKFTGPVRMLIYNREEFDAPKLQKEESDE